MVVAGFATQAGDGAIAHAGPIKKTKRAIQKLQRSYGLENHRRLLDLVRASIVCDTIATLWRVVEVVQKGLVDQDALILSQVSSRVVRAKNRFKDGFNSAETGG